MWIESKEPAGLPASRSVGPIGSDREGECIFKPPRIGGMEIVSFMTDPPAADRVLCYRESERCKTQDPFEPRSRAAPVG